ncbi:DNase I-like protein [Meredithblackwellia eburnea MCA 4105]
MHDPFGPTFLLTPRPLLPLEGSHLGSITASTIVPSHPTSLFLSHDNGYISVWSTLTASRGCTMVQRVSPYGITAMVGVGRYLWVGFRSGFINVLDVGVEPWTVKKTWKAHEEMVGRIVVNERSVWEDESLQVASSGGDMIVQIWDGFLRDDWLETELHLRQREFCTYRTIRALCISWNVDACKPQDLATGNVPQNFEFLQECLTSVDGPDIISFGFQEMIDLESKKLTAKTLILGKKKAEQKFSDTVSSSYRLWHDKLIQAVRLAMPPECPYTVVHVGDLVGLFSCIFVKNAERERLRDVALITVKTGMGGRYGNKGSIISRFVIDDTSICFLNCHLAAGQSHRRQRDSDLAQILEDKSAFSELASSSPGAYTSGGLGTSVFDHELCILSGDLNYRIDQRRDTVVKAVMDGNVESLLPHDQLLKGLATNQTFRLRSFKEAPLTFAPTYKYDPGTDEYDSSAKKRIPAWCDRVLWRADQAEKVTPLHYRRYECNVSDHKPISAALDLRVKSIIPDKRAVVWKEVESSWFGVESQLLQEARLFYVQL